MLCDVVKREEESIKHV